MKPPPYPLPQPPKGLSNGRKMEDPVKTVALPLLMPPPATHLPVYPVTPWSKERRPMFLKKMVLSRFDPQQVLRIQPMVSWNPEIMKLFLASQRMEIVNQARFIKWHFHQRVQELCPKEEAEVSNILPMAATNLRPRDGCGLMNIPGYIPILKEDGFTSTPPVRSWWFTVPRIKPGGTWLNSF